MNPRPMTLTELVGLVHRHLPLDAVFVTELSGHDFALQASAGNAAVPPGVRTPVSSSFSRKVAETASPIVVPDVSKDPFLANLPVTAELGIHSYVGVPLHLSDDSLFGVLSAVSCSPETQLSERDVSFMSMVAELIKGDLDEHHRLNCLRADVMDVIEEERINIAFQPIVDLVTGRCLGLEALSRFGAPYSTPVAAFEAAEAVGLGIDLERLAISKAWGALADLTDQQFLTVNVTPPALLTLADRANKRTDLDLSQVVVEMTENAIVPAYDELRGKLGPLRQRGLRLAIDDVGAGYASLHNVVELRPDFIKIDTSLVQGVADDHARRVTISSFVRLAWKLNATIVAEGIETERDLHALKRLHVAAGQGYLLDRPSTNRADLLRWTSSWTNSSRLDAETSLNTRLAQLADNLVIDEVKRADAVHNGVEKRAMDGELAASGQLERRLRR